MTRWWFAGLLLALSACNTSTAGVPVSPQAGEARQALVFSGAQTGVWSSARVTQCEVLSSSPNGVAVLQVFLKGTLGGASYDLALGLVNYTGPGRYAGGINTIVTGPPQPVVGPAGTTPGVVRGTSVSSGPSVATLYRDPPSRGNAVGEYDIVHNAVVTVAGNGYSGTIDAYFARTGQPVPGPRPVADPASVIHVAGGWSCGAYPIHPHRGSPSPAS